MPELKPTMQKLNLKIVAIVAGIALITFLVLRYGWVVGYAIMHESEIKIMSAYQKASYEKKLGN